MEESFTEHLLNQHKQNLLIIDNNNNFNANNVSRLNSEDYHLSQFDLGMFSGKVLGEINEQHYHDTWENVLTVMFLIGVILIPIQLIFAENLKYVDLYVVNALQQVVGNVNGNINDNGMVYNCASFCSDVSFYMSILVFIYVAVDSGIAFKTLIVGNISSFLVYILKLITHDTRPYWSTHYNNHTLLIKHSYASPSLTCFVGMLYTHYLHFNINRALMSNDKFINKSRSFILHSKHLSLLLIFINYINGLFFICQGAHYIYQILITYFYGFIVIRIVIIFNKEIDSYTNGTRFILTMSNAFVMYVLFIVGVLAVIGGCAYCVVYDDVYEKEEDALEETLIELCGMFYSVGATFGVNYTLRNMKNSSGWMYTRFGKRIVRGVIAFVVNYVGMCICRRIRFDVVVNSYIVGSIMYMSLGFVVFGVMVVFMERLKLTSGLVLYEDVKRKEDEEREKLLLEDDDHNKELLRI